MMETNLKYPLVIEVVMYKNNIIDNRILSEVRRNAHINQIGNSNLNFYVPATDIKEILKKISEKSNNLILDTVVCLDESRPLLELKPENKHYGKIDKPWSNELLQNVSGDYNLVPNLSALKILLKSADYQNIKVLEPNKNSKNLQADYIKNKTGKRKRITLVARKKLEVV